MTDPSVSVIGTTPCFLVRKQFYNSAVFGHKHHVCQAHTAPLPLTGWRSKFTIKGRTIVQLTDSRHSLPVQHWRLKLIIEKRTEEKGLRSRKV